MASKKDALALPNLGLWCIRELFEKGASEDRYFSSGQSDHLNALSYKQLDCEK